MKTLRIIAGFCVSYLVGNFFVVVTHSLLGDEIYAILKVLLDWLPVSLVYAALAAVVLSRLGLNTVFGMVELCGFWIGLLPLLFLWPPYMCIWNLAVPLVLAQCVSIAVVILLRWGVFKLSHK